MLISHQYKFIFLKTHKTASTSAEAVLEMLCTQAGHRPEHMQAEIQSSFGYVSGRMGGQTKSDFLQAHAGAQAIERAVGRDIFHEYIKVYTIRNPYDKVVSWFWHVMPEITRCRIERNFSDTVQLFSDWLNMRPILPKDLNIYRTSDGFFPADRIRFENLSVDLSIFGQKIGGSIDLTKIPRWKTDSRGHRNRNFYQYYNKNTRDIVRRKFKYDFEHFGYQE